MTDSIVDQIKSKLRIEDVIEQDGYPLDKKHGRWRKVTGRKLGGLVVDALSQTYAWHSTSEWGDVIQWVINRNNVDFKAACELLCRRAGLPEPNWSGQDPNVRLAARLREDALEVAQRVFIRWLARSEAAQAYVNGRGWQLWQDLPADEPPGGAERQAGAATLAKLGYSGEGSDAERQELQGEMIAAGVDLDSPIAVAILGWRGDVAGWAAKHDLETLNMDWVERSYIPGIFGKNRLVYPHLVNGRIRYLSGRGIVEKYHYNLPESLAGKRQVFYNHVYATATDSVVIVEGQADAISWGHWGYAAIALAGVSMDGDLAEEILKRHKNIYLALDIDHTGINNAWKMGEAFGPGVRLLSVTDPGQLLLLPDDAPTKTRELVERAQSYLRAISAVMRWPIGERYASYPTSDGEKPVKDANDLLRSMAAAGHGQEQQASIAKLLLDRAPTFVEAVASWAGAREGAARDEAMKQAVMVINRLDEFSLAQNKGRLSKFLQVTMRELERMLKAAAVQAQRSRAGGEAVYTWGGSVDGWLLEYLYDRERDQAQLAWRDPDGRIDCGPGVSIDGRYYEPYPPNDLLKMGSIHFPSGLGEKKSIAELITYLRMYLKSVYIMPSDKLTKLVAYWILETWLYDCFSSTIYLRAMGSAGAGKSEFVLRVGLACYRMMQASGTDTTASLFRAVHRYKGTVLIDEADISYSDTDNEMVKFYNQGAFKGRPIMRTREITLEDGSKDWETVAYNIYSPKLIGMRKDFKDDAVGTRSLTLKLVTREMPELLAAGIPLNVDENILAKAQAIRNLLLRFRLEHWQPDIPIDAAWFDLSISPRLNQVAGPLLAIARDDPDQQEDIRQVLRDYYQETILNQSMTLAARIIEALWKIWKYPDLHKEMVKVDEEGNSLMKIGDVTRIANEIMNEMNDPDGDDEDDAKRQRRSEIKAQRVGRILREDLMMQVSDRRRDGFWVYWNEARMIGLSTKFGVNPENFGPQPEAPKASQGRLVN